MRYFEIKEGVRMGARELSNIGLDRFTIGFEFEVELDGIFGDDDDGELDMEAAVEAHREYWIESDNFTFEDFIREEIDIKDFVLENEINPVYGWVEDIEDYVEYLNVQEKYEYDKKISIMRSDMRKYSDEFIEEFKNFYENGYNDEIEDDLEKLKELVLFFQMNNPKNIFRYPSADDREERIKSKMSTMSKTALENFFSHDLNYFLKLFYLRADRPKVYSVDDVDLDFSENEYIYDEYGDVISISNSLEDLDELVKYFNIDEAGVRDILAEDFADSDDERRREDFDSWLQDNAGRFIDGGSSAISYVKDKVESLGYNWDVIDDGSLQNGAEIISEVFEDIEDGFESMREIFDMISDDEHIRTSVRTGFHINIGTWRGTEIDDMDWLKFLVIYRSGRLLDEFRRRMNDFSKDRLGEIIESLERMDLKPFYNNMESINSIVLGSSVKNSAINLSKLRNDGIIEIRAVGNSGYETKSDYIIEEVKKIIRALEIAGNREAYQKEYAKKLYKLLSSAYNKRMGRSENPVEDFFRRLSGGIMNDYEYLRAYNMIISLITTNNFDINVANNNYTSRIHRNIVDDLREYESRYARINGENVKENIEFYLEQYDNDGSIRNSKFINNLLKAL